MILIVWYHTSHPSFLDYTFYNASLFFVSGMLFVPNKGDFFHKKIRRLIIPFVFFYLLYYFFIVSLNFVKYHSISYEVLGSIFDAFRWYSDNDGYNCNYPLWFIGALFGTQLMAKGMFNIIRNSWVLLFIAFFVSVVSSLYIVHIPTPFFWGRSLTFLFYYVAGYVLYNKIQEQRMNVYGTVACFLWFVLLWMDSSIQFVEISLKMMELCAFSIVLLVLCKMMNRFKIMSFLSFWGINSLILLGMHDMFLTILRILTINLCGGMTLWLGLINWILTLGLIVPTIFFLNKYCPVLIGKKR